MACLLQLIITWIPWIVGALFLLIVFGQSVRIVQEFDRLVVFRLGRVVGSRGPGFVLIIPIIERAVSVDLRERFFDVEPQTCITKDNSRVDIDFIVYMRVINTVASLVNVQDVIGASRLMAITNLRAVVGDLPLDDVLAKRDQINHVMQEKLDEVTDRWGIKVNAVEIKEINPPRDIQEAMTRQMSAERTRRAMVLEADGQRESSIKVAEGEKQATVLKADGERQAAVLKAQGGREAAILQAQGYALALKEIYGQAKEVDGKTMSLQYLETLKALGASPATKFIFPVEFTNLLRPISEFTGRSS